MLGTLCRELRQNPFDLQFFFRGQLSQLIIPEEEISCTSPGTALL